MKSSVLCGAPPCEGRGSDSPRTYVAVAPFHLFRYLDEESFRFNKRKGTDFTRLVEAMCGTVGKRLQFAEPVGQELAGGCL